MQKFSERSQATLFRWNGQVHIDYYTQKLDLWYIGYFNIQGLDVKFIDDQT